MNNIGLSAPADVWSINAFFASDLCAPSPAYRSNASFFAGTAKQMPLVFEI